VLGSGLALLEVFFPSAGILAFLAISALLAAVVMAFYQSTSLGIVFAVGGARRADRDASCWPSSTGRNTAMGKRVLLMAPTSEDVLPDDPEKGRLKSLIGRTGRGKEPNCS